MWGNKLGWGISAAIVAFMGWVVWVLIQAGTPAPPTSFLTDAVLGPLAFPAPPTQVVSSMTDQTDSGPDYQAAIADYKRNPRAYDLSKIRSFDANAAKLPGVLAMLHATDSSKANIFGGNLAAVVNYQGEREDMEALSGLAKAVSTLGLYRKAKDPKDAAKYFEAEFSLGAKMYQERLVYDEMFRGIGIMGEATAALISLAESSGDKARAQALRDFEGARRDYYENSIKPVWNVISSIDPGIIAIHPGNVAKIAADGKEHMWRVEAAMKLGRQRYYSERAGDQRAARWQLRKLAADPDPAVALAARLGQELSIEQYRMLR